MFNIEIIEGIGSQMYKNKSSVLRDYKMLISEREIPLNDKEDRKAIDSGSIAKANSRWESRQPCPIQVFQMHVICVYTCLGLSMYSISQK